MNPRRSARIAAFVTSALLAATACSGAGDKKLTLIYMAHAYQPRVVLDTALIARYEKLHPNVHIKQTVIPSTEFHAKVKDALAANRVDVFAEEAPLAEYFASASAAPVDFRAMGYRSLQDLEAKYIPHGLDPFTYKGTLYAVPTEANSMAMYINTTLFNTAGIDPTTDYPKTWEDVLALSKRLVKRDRLGRIIQAGFDFTYPGNPTGEPPLFSIAAMIAQKGGTIVSPDHTRSTFNSPAAVAVFKFIKEWVFTHRLGGPGAPEAFAGFMEGKLAMTLKGPWVEQLLKTQAPDIYKNLLIVPFPMFEGAVAPYAATVDAYGLMVNAHDTPEKQRASWSFISYLRAAPVELMKKTGNLIPRVEAYEQLDEIAATFKFVDVFLEMLKRPQLALNDVPQSAAINKAVENAILHMATKDLTPAQAVAEADRGIQAALDSA